MTPLASATTPFSSLSLSPSPPRSINRGNDDLFLLSRYLCSFSFFCFCLEEDKEQYQGESGGRCLSMEHMPGNRFSSSEIGREISFHLYMHMLCDRGSYCWGPLQSYLLKKLIIILTLLLVYLRLCNAQFVQ